TPEVYVHRLTALASKSEELIAPEWTRHKMTSYQGVIDHLHKHQLSQGQFFKIPTEVTHAAH
ncbi:MAG: hypothetical protein IT287_02760, partial [Bdellovibrionaceae bacterium]|nr:hypothetical protein [Pseudobdellovibrionaceae bacterium]